MHTCPPPLCLPLLPPNGTLVPFHRLLYRPPAPCPSGQASIFRSRLHLGNARQWDLIHATSPLFNRVFQQVSAALDVKISIILPFRSPSVPESCELPLLRRCSQQATRTAKRTRIITQLTFSFLNFSCRFSVKAWRVLCGASVRSNAGSLQKQLLLSTKMSLILMWWVFNHDEWAVDGDDTNQEAAATGMSTQAFSFK